MEECCGPEKARLVLDIVLKTIPGLTQSQWDVFSMQQTCSSWQAVLRSAATHSVDVSCRRLSDPNSLQQLSQWMTSHAALVGSLRLDTSLWPKAGQQPDSSSSSSENSDSSPSISLLWSHQAVNSSSNRSAGACSDTITDECWGCVASTSSSSSAGSSSTSSLCATSSSAAAVDTAPGLVKTLHAAAAAGMRLQHFSSNYLYSPAVLQALPNCVTSLELSRLLGDPQLTTRSTDLTSAMSRFTALQSLTLGRTYSSSSLAGGLLPPALLDCLSSLPSLSTLALQKVPLAAAEAAALPAQLSRLVFDSCTLPADMQLAHMTQLLELDMVGPQPPQHPSLEVSAGAAASSRLPPSLTALTLLTAKQRHTSLAVGHLTDLQQLAVLDSREDPAWLAQAATLPALKHLRLRYLSWRSLLAAGPCWRGLPTLQALELCGLDLRSHWQLEALSSSLAAATTLTAITVNRLSTRQPVKLCPAIQDLPNLASLELTGVQLARLDPLSLTRLTGLTRLAVVNCTSVFDDVAAVAVCLHLSKLRSLELVSQGLVSVGMLYPAAVGIKGLESLSICGRSSCRVDEVCVGMLSSLSRLTALSLPGDAAGLAVAVQGLRRVLPALGSVNITQPV